MLNYKQMLRRETVTMAGNLKEKMKTQCMNE